MPASLAEIVENKRCELEKRKAKRPLSAFKNQVHQCNFEFEAALSQFGVNLICEIKPKSPSAGTLNAKVNVKKVVALYSKYAKAISVLTDEKYFGGSIDLLRKVSSSTKLPTLCKDFVIDPYQCFEARHAGAKGILLIVKILEDDQLKLLNATAMSLGLTAVVEVQTGEELKRALLIDPKVLLINNRNLDTFETDLQTTHKLAPTIPIGKTVICASGINTKRDIERLLPFCLNFLIGSALMKSDDMETLLAQLAKADLTFASGVSK